MCDIKYQFYFGSVIYKNSYYENLQLVNKFYLQLYNKIIIYKRVQNWAYIFVFPEVDSR